MAYLEQPNAISIRDFLEAPTDSPPFPPLMEDTVNDLLSKRGIVANRLSLLDLARSPESYGVSYFAGEKKGSGYFVYTMHGGKKVPATFLFPAKVLNGTSLKFSKPRLDSTFTVAGIYCRVLCDDVTAQGVQNFLQSSTVLNKDQVVRGKRFEFGSIAIPGSLESQHFTRFNRSF
ncbi:hypothetical protein HDU77_001216, partial [Chytriomyces hyalinus]